MIHRTITAMLALLLLLPLYPLPAHAQSVAPTLPQATIETVLRPPSGRSIAVGVGANLQTAIDGAMPGDEVVLAAGATFTGNFALKFSGVIIRSSQSSQLPVGSRVNPSNAPLMAKVLSPNNMGAFYTIGKASGYRLIGLEIGLAPSVTVANTGLVRFGDFSETNLANVPSGLIIDRCYLHGSPSQTVRRAVALNSAASAVIDSYISEIHEVGSDSQAIWGANGPGPYKIENNYLEAAGENVMFGGADSSIVNLVPSDIEIKRNTITKPLAWRTQAYTIKNLFELKSARRVLVEGNLITNCWAQAQTGFALNIKSANQDGGTGAWSVTEDVTIINNIIAHTGSAVTVSGADPDTNLKTKRIKIANNLFYDINSSTYGGSGIFAQIVNGAQGVEFDHNTALASGNIITADGEPTIGLSFTNSILQHNAFGVKGSGQGIGNPTLAFYFPAAVFKKNLIIGPDSFKTSYPADNVFVPSVAFADATTGNYRASGLPLGSDGKAVGADLDAIAAAMSGPSPTPTPEPRPTSITLFTITKEGTEIVIKDAAGVVIKRFPLQ